MINSKESVGVTLDFFITDNTERHCVNIRRIISFIVKKADDQEKVRRQNLLYWLKTVANKRNNDIL